MVFQKQNKEEEDKMKLTYEGIRDKAAWQQAGIELPSYDPRISGEKAHDMPEWVHFGIGNIFRVFIGSIADRLLSSGKMTTGIVCAETYDTELVDRIYRPYDNLVLSIILNADGTKEKKVLGGFAEAIKAVQTEREQWNRLGQVFSSPSLQMVSFTITEKGYALKDTEGEFYSFVRQDIENGPAAAKGVIAVVASMLYERFKAGGFPLALVSMDNCSKNGDRLAKAVQCIAGEWEKRGYVGKDFIDYVCDEKRIAFPWSMIDKITPRPLESLAKELKADGVEDMDIIVTDKHTFIAPFGNAEKPQYLVIEDSFPNGRPPLEEAGVYMTDRDTVNKSEKMKVTVCLNPLHTALCTYDCLLGYDLFAEGMKDDDLLTLARLIGYQEGMAVVPDPGILSPKAFLDEVVNERFPNVYLGDTSQRIATDISQMVGIRFGETIKAYVERYGDAKKLTGIPLAIAGWLRYLLAVDDSGKPMELAPDPMIPELQRKLEGIELGKPFDAHEYLKDILSNEIIFGTDLYKAGIGDRIEEMFAKEVDGTGSVRKTLHKHLAAAKL
jgi:fructuronate reductase